MYRKERATLIWPISELRSSWPISCQIWAFQRKVIFCVIFFSKIFTEKKVMEVCFFIFVYWEANQDFYEILISKLTQTSTGIARRRMLANFSFSNSLRSVPLEASQSKTIFCVLLGLWIVSELSGGSSVKCFVWFPRQFGSVVLETWTGDELDGVQPAVSLFFQKLNGWKSRTHTGDCCNRVPGQRPVSWHCVLPLKLGTYPKKMFKIANDKLTASLIWWWEIWVSPSSSTSNTNQDLRSWNDTSSTSRTVRCIFCFKARLVVNDKWSGNKHRCLSNEEVISVVTSRDEFLRSAWLSMVALVHDGFEALESFAGSVFFDSEMWGEQLCPTLGHLTRDQPKRSSKSCPPKPSNSQNLPNVGGQHEHCFQLASNVKWTILHESQPYVLDRNVASTLVVWLQNMCDFFLKVIRWESRNTSGSNQGNFRRSFNEHRMSSEPYCTNLNHTFLIEM